MAKRNIDKLREEDDEKLAAFLVEIFDIIGAPLPYSLCRRCVGRANCNIRKCKYRDIDFMLEWLYSEKRSMYGRRL